MPNTTIPSTRVFYKVRIDPELREEFMATIPWGYQGEVIEALMTMLFNEVDKHGAMLAVAKLVDGRYKLVEKR